MEAKEVITEVAKYVAGAAVAAGSLWLKLRQNKSERQKGALDGMQVLNDQLLKQAEALQQRIDRTNDSEKKELLLEIKEHRETVRSMIEVIRNLVEENQDLKKKLYENRNPSRP